MGEEFSPATWLVDSIDWTEYENIDQQVLKFAFETAERQVPSFWKLKMKANKVTTGGMMTAYVINKKKWRTSVK